MAHKRLQEIPIYKADPPRERTLHLIFSPQIDPGIKDCTVLMANLVPRTGRSGLHSHSVDEIMYIVSGEGEIFQDGETIKLEPGTAIYAPAGTEHETKNFGEKPLEILCTYIPSLSDEQIEEYVRNSK